VEVAEALDDVLELILRRLRNTSREECKINKKEMRKNEN
jgi:hypothetical protein